jgi:hypothetical protein
MGRRILVLARNETYGFTRVSDVVVNSKVTGLQMYLQKGQADLDYRTQRGGLKRYKRI